MLELWDKYWLLLLSVLAVLLVLWAVAVLSKYVRLMLNIIRDTPVPLIGPLDFVRIVGRQLNFRAFDGTLLRGMFLSRQCLTEPDCPGNEAGPISRREDNDDYLNGDTRGVVIFCHEYGSDMYSCARYCRPLLEAGFDVFTFDFRSHGASSSLKGYEPRLWCSDKEISDCLGALALVQSMLQERKLDVNMGLFGISRGASAAIMAAVQAGPILPVKAVVADGAFSTDTTLEWSMKKWVHIFARVRFVYENHRPIFWHFLRWLLLKFARIRFGCSFPSVRKNLRRLKDTAIFFIHGGRDSYIPPEHTRILFAEAHQPRYLWIVPEAKHNQSVMVEPGLYSARMVAFFERYLDQADPATIKILESCKKDVWALDSTGEGTAFHQKGKKGRINVSTVDRLWCGPEGAAPPETVRKAITEVSGDSEPAAKKNLERQSRQ